MSATASPGKTKNSMSMAVAAFVAIGLLAAAGFAYQFITSGEAVAFTHPNASKADRETLPVEPVITEAEVQKGLTSIAETGGTLAPGVLLMGYIEKDIQIEKQTSELLVLRIVEIAKSSTVREKPDETCFLLAPAELFKGEFVRPAQMRCYRGDGEAYRYAKVRGQVITGDDLPALEELDPEYGAENEHVVVVLTETASRQNIAAARQP